MSYRTPDYEPQAHHARKADWLAAALRLLPFVGLVIIGFAIGGLFKPG